MSDFDAAALAGEAVGEAADTAAGATETAEVATSEGSEAGEGRVDPDAEGDEETRSIVHSLLFAPERGPTQSTFVAVGIDEDPALAIDGAVDWLLDVVGGDAADELGDSLGPLGKMATGVGRMVTSDDSGDDDRDDADGELEGAGEELGAVVA